MTERKTYSYRHVRPEDKYITVCPRSRKEDKVILAPEFISMHARRFSPETINLIELLGTLDEENMNILKDCEMTGVILDRVVSFYDWDIGKSTKLSKEILNYLDSMGYSKENAGLRNRSLVKGQNYLFLYKILRSFGYDNYTINKVIEENVYVIIEEDFSLLNNKKSIDYIRSMIPDTASNEEIFNFVVNYSKLKKILNTFKIKENEEQIIKEHIKKNGLVQNFSGEEEKNAKFLKTISKLGGVSFTNLQQNVVNNLDVLLTISYTKLFNYMAMFEYGGLDYEVLNSNLGVIREYEAEFPIELYRYVEKSHEENLPLRSLETINRIKDNYSYDVLKRTYPVVVDKENVVTKISRKYKDKLNAQIMENNFKRQRKEV